MEHTPVKRRSSFGSPETAKSQRTEEPATPVAEVLEEQREEPGVLELSVQEVSNAQLKLQARSDAKLQRLLQATQVVSEVFDTCALGKQLVSLLYTSSALLSKMPAKDVCNNEGLWTKVVAVRTDCEKFERMVIDFVDEVNEVKNALCKTSTFIAGLVRESKSKLDATKAGHGTWDFKQVEGTVRRVVDNLQEINQMQMDLKNKYKELLLKERGDAIIELRNELSGVTRHASQLVYDMQSSRSPATVAAGKLARAQSDLDYAIQSRELAEMEQNIALKSLERGRQSIEKTTASLERVRAGAENDLEKTVQDMDDIVKAEIATQQREAEMHREEMLNKQAIVDKRHIERLVNAEVEPEQQKTQLQHHFHVVWEGTQTVSEKQRTELLEQLGKLRDRDGAAERLKDWVSLTHFGGNKCSGTLQRDWDVVLDVISNSAQATDHAFPLNDALLNVEKTLQQVTQANPTKKICTTVVLCTVRGKMRHGIMTWFKKGGWKKLACETSQLAAKVCAVGNRSLHRCAGIILVADEVDDDTKRDMLDLVSCLNSGEKQASIAGILRPLLFSQSTWVAHKVEETVIALESRWADLSASNLWQQGIVDTNIQERMHHLQILEQSNRRQLQNGIEELKVKLQVAEEAQEHGCNAQKSRRQALQDVLQKRLEQECHEQHEREELRDESRKRVVAAREDEARHTQAIAFFKESMQVAQSTHDPERIKQEYETQEAKLRSLYSGFDRAGVAELLRQLSEHVQKNKLQLNNTMQVLDMVVAPVLAQFSDMQNVYSHLDDRVMPQRVIKQFVDDGMFLSEEDTKAVDQKAAWVKILAHSCPDVDEQQLRKFKLALKLDNFCFSKVPPDASQMEEQAAEREKRNRDRLMSYLRGLREFRNTARDITRLESEHKRLENKKKNLEGKVKALIRKRDGDEEDDPPIRPIELTPKEEESLEKHITDVDNCKEKLADLKGQKEEMEEEMKAAVMETYDDLFTMVLPSVSGQVGNVCRGIILSSGAEQFYRQLESLVHLYGGQVMPFLHGIHDVCSKVMTRPPLMLTD